MLSPLGRDLLEQRWARGANLQRLCRPWRCVILGIAHIKTICTASRDRRGQSQVPIPECRSRRIDTAASTETVLRLLDDSHRAGVRPDSVQVPGGRLSSGLPTRSRVWLTFGLQPVGHRDEAWLKRGLPCS